jgi:hypothetical protein
MLKRIATFAAGVACGGLLLTAGGSQAAEQHIPEGFQPIVVTQHTSLFEAPYCSVLERTRVIDRKFDGTKVRRHPWSDWKVVDYGHPTDASDGTICAVQH